MVQGTVSLNQKYSLTNRGAPLREAALVMLHTAHFAQLYFNPEKYTFTILLALSQTLHESRMEDAE